MSDSNNIIRMPYAVMPRQWIDKLIRMGFLKSSRRHDAKAVEDAIVALKKSSQDVLHGLD
jgi:hypothetical protein